MIEADREDLPEFAIHAMKNMHKFKRMHVFELLTQMPQGEFVTMGVLEDKAHEKECGGMRVSELAAILRNSPAASSKMLNVLEDKGCVERFIDKKNRRNTYVKLTQEGLRRLQEAHARMNAYVFALQAELGEEACTEFFNLQNRMLDITEDYLEKLQKKDGENQKNRRNEEPC